MRWFVSSHDLLCFCVPAEMNSRNGTDVDAAMAVKTFSDLGYKIKFFNDQTIKEMNRLMQSGMEPVALLTLY